MVDFHQWLKDGMDALKASAQDQVQRAIGDLLAGSLTPERLMRLLAILSDKGIDLSGRPQGKDPYDVLGLEKTATDEEVRIRFRERTKLFHPDTSSIPGSAFLFQMTLEAYRQISMERGWS